jgi:hypothetical protein
MRVEKIGIFAIFGLFHYGGNRDHHPGLDSHLCGRDWHKDKRIGSAIYLYFLDTKLYLPFRVRLSQSYRYNQVQRPHSRATMLGNDMRVLGFMSFPGCCIIPLFDLVRNNSVSIISFAAFPAQRVQSFFQWQSNFKYDGFYDHFIGGVFAGNGSADEVGSRYVLLFFGCF